MSAKASSCLLCCWLERSVGLQPMRKRRDVCPVHTRIRIALRVIHVPHKSPFHHHRPITRFRGRAASATRSIRAPPNLHGT
ncbi:hypothetical protein BJ912DRAFT_999387, partial [Pholiota molesta]